MAVVIQTPIVWSVDGASIQVQPAPLVTNRPPSSADTGPIGAVWVDSSTLGVYVLARVHGASTWVTTPGSGSGIFTDVLVSPGDLIVDTGATDLQALTVQGVANFSTDVNFNGGVITINADLDLSSAQAIELVTTADVARALYLNANGGTTTTTEYRNQTGTSLSAMKISADVGGVDIDGALLVSITSSRNNAQALLLEATAGGIDILASGAAAGEDIDIIATGSSVNVQATEADASAITIHASDAAGGVKIRAGSNGIEIGNDADCAVIDLGDIAPTSSRLVTVAGGTVTTAVTDRVDIAVDGVSTSASATKQVDIASGNVLLGSSVVNINSGTAASGTSTVNISSGTGGGTKAVNVGNADGLTNIVLDGLLTVNSSVNKNVSFTGGTSTGTFSVGNALGGAVTVDSAAGISLDAAAASNFSCSGAAIDLTLASSAGSVILNGGEAAVDAVRIFASNGAGGIDLDYGTAGMTMTGANGALTIATGTGAVNVSADAANTSVNVATGAGVKTLVLGSSNTTSTSTIQSGSGGIHLTSAGLVAITNATDTQASPTATSVMNVNNGIATFTGFTTAAAGTQVFTITNSLVSTSSPLIVTACNEGAADAQMTVTRVKRAAGSFEVTLTNNGAASLDGNVAISFLVGA